MLLVGAVVSIDWFEILVFILVGTVVVGLVSMVWSSCGVELVELFAGDLGQAFVVLLFDFLWLVINGCFEQLREWDEYVFQVMI